MRINPVAPNNSLYLAIWLLQVLDASTKRKKRSGKSQTPGLADRTCHTPGQSRNLWSGGQAGRDASAIKACRQNSLSTTQINHVALAPGDQQPGQNLKSQSGSTENQARKGGDNAGQWEGEFEGLSVGDGLRGYWLLAAGD